MKRTVARHRHPLRQTRITYRGGAVLRAITIWLKALGDTP